MKRTDSRIRNTTLNLASSLFGQFLIIILSFITRTVFIETLGKQYLGISSLFANILSMLSLTEFGVGNAIIFRLYRPIVNDDIDRIKVLMKFFRNAYRVIGLAVLLLGIGMIPFLKFLIKDYNTLSALNINAVVIFLLYLLQSVSTYLFFAYKTMIVKAHQKEYVLTVMGYFLTVITYLVQIFVLFAYQNFILYVLILVVSNIIRNIVYARIADKMFPFLKNKESRKLEKSEIVDIFKDSRALFIYKLDSVVLNATDNIVLAKFIGIVVVGVYSNYLLFFTTIKGILMKFYDALVASLGNLHASSDSKKEYEIFKTINFITTYLYGVSAIGLAIISNELINIWIGEEYLIRQPFSILLGLQMYTLGLRIFLAKFRTSMGLFQQAMYRPIFSIIINLVVSISLVNRIGINGVLIGTIVADWSTVMWYDPFVIHRDGFKDIKKLKKYCYDNIKYIFTVFVSFIIAHLTIKFIEGDGVVFVVIHIIICVIVPSLLYYIIYRKNDEFIYIKGVLIRLISKIANKNTH